MKYRKRPVVVEVEQFVTWNKDIINITLHGVTYPVYEDNKGKHIIIPTLEGNHRANELDWIVKGVIGEYYPCKPSAFEKTYEKVEE